MCGEMWGMKGKLKNRVVWGGRIKPSLDDVVVVEFGRKSLRKLESILSSGDLILLAG